MAKYNGKSASVTVGGVQMPGYEWTWDPDVEEDRATDFRDAASPANDGSVWDTHTVGFGKATVTVQMMFDDAVTLPVHGALVAFVGYYGGGHGVSCSVWIKGCGRNAAIGKTGRVTLKGLMNGNPTFS